MKYISMLLFAACLSIASSSFAMDRGGRGVYHREDFNRNDRNHWNNSPGTNIYISPQGNQPYYQPYYYDAFPDDAEQDRIYEENLRN